MWLVEWETLTEYNKSKDTEFNKIINYRILVKILQLSDIHWSKTSSMLDEFKDLRDGMEEYLEIYHKQFPEKFDYIFVCGDIAFSGEENQYKKARVL